jgi:GT2 family glycosyltransferase
LAIRQARGEYIVRLDAHSIPAPDYVQRCVEALEGKKGDNVGGVWQIEPGGPGWLARSIAVAAGHPLGAGDARYRVGGAAQPVDTVPFGAFHRSLVARAGFFDENLLTNEDYEFNVRVRQAGGRVWMDPSIRTRYFARPELKSLARQYARYGYWKARMLRRYPHTLRWRQLLPPAFVLGMAALGLLALFIPPVRVIWLAVAGLYLVVLAAAGAQAAISRGEAGLLPGVPMALATMHFCWGSAFLWSLLKR